MRSEVRGCEWWITHHPNRSRLVDVAYSELCPQMATFRLTHHFTTITDDSEFDPEHDEYRTFVVAVCDADDGEPLTGQVTTFTSEGNAAEYANMIANGREVHWE